MGGSAGVEPVNVWSVSLNETLNGSQEGGEGFLDNFIIGSSGLWYIDTQQKRERESKNYYWQKSWYIDTQKKGEREPKKV